MYPVKNKCVKNRSFQQDMATALANLATSTAAYRTTLASITSALASSNAEMVFLKRKLKIQINPKKTDSSMGIASGHLFLPWEGAHQCILQVAEVRAPKRGNQGKQNEME